MKESISTRMHILECAINLFKESGYDQVTIKNICEKAEVAKSTFYYHYQTKEDLIKDFFKTIDINVEQMMQALLTDDNCLEQMWRIIELYYQRLIDAGIEITRMVYMTNLVQDKHILGADNAIAKDMYLTLLKRAREKKVITNCSKNNEDLYSSLVYSLTGISYLWCVQEGKFDLLSECRKTYETVLGYNPQNKNTSAD
jgi:AcrR family transcriptional regulator